MGADVGTPVSGRPTVGLGVKVVGTAEIVGVKGVGLADGEPVGTTNRSSPEHMSLTLHFSLPGSFNFQIW